MADGDGGKVQIKGQLEALFAGGASPGMPRRINKSPAPTPPSRSSSPSARSSVSPAFTRKGAPPTPPSRSGNQRMSNLGMAIDKPAPPSPLSRSSPASARSSGSPGLPRKFDGAMDKGAPPTPPYRSSPSPARSSPTLPKKFGGAKNKPAPPLRPGLAGDYEWQALPQGLSAICVFNYYYDSEPPMLLGKKL